MNEITDGRLLGLAGCVDLSTGHMLHVYSASRR